MHPSTVSGYYHKYVDVYSIVVARELRNFSLTIFGQKLGEINFLLIKYSATRYSIVFI